MPSWRALVAIASGRLREARCTLVHRCCCVDTELVTTRGVLVTMGNSCSAISLAWGAVLLALYHRGRVLIALAAHLVGSMSVLAAPFWYKPNNCCTPLFCSFSSVASPPHVVQLPVMAGKK